MSIHHQLPSPNAVLCGKSKHTPGPHRRGAFSRIWVTPGLYVGLPTWRLPTAEHLTGTLSFLLSMAPGPQDGRCPRPSQLVPLPTPPSRTVPPMRTRSPKPRFSRPHFLSTWPARFLSLTITDATTREFSTENAQRQYPAAWWYRTHPMACSKTSKGLHCPPLQISKLS